MSCKNVSVVAAVTPEKVLRVRARKLPFCITHRIVTSNPKYLLLCQKSSI